MTARVGPNVEAAAAAWLLASPELVDLVGDRIGTELDLSAPSALPALRLTRVSTVSPARRALDGATVQVEGWAEDSPTARLVCELARGRLLADGFAAVHAAATITGVDDAGGPRPLPDPQTETPRWIASVTIYGKHSNL